MGLGVLQQKLEDSIDEKFRLHEKVCNLERENKKLKEELEEAKALISLEVNLKQWRVKK